jgi:hypothetical protein
VTLKSGTGGPTSTKATLAKGDTLVPYEQTIRWLGEHLVPFIEAFESPCREHAFLNCDPIVAGRIRSNVRP